MGILQMFSHSSFILPEAEVTSQLNAIRISQIAESPAVWPEIFMVPPRLHNTDITWPKQIPIHSSMMKSDLTDQTAFNSNSSSANF